MQKTFKLIGIIAFITVFGLVLSGCREKTEDIYVKVINQHSETITEVRAFHPDGWWIDRKNNLNIVTGSELIVTITDYDEGDGLLGFKKGNIDVRITTESEMQRAVNKTVSAGQTITVTLKSDGTLE